MLKYCRKEVNTVSNFNSDLKKLLKESEKTALEEASKIIEGDTYDVECPYCNKEFEARQGKNICPHCEETVELNLEINL